MTSPSPSSPPNKAARVAVITRTKNRPILLDRALKSVVGQTFADWRLIVVNDAGEVGSVEACVSALDPELAEKVSILNRQSSVGMEAASNHGIAISTSEFVCIHDDDDSWEPDFLKECVAFLDAAGDLYEGVVTRTTLVKERLTEAGPEIASRELFNPSINAVSLASVLTQNAYPPISFLFRRKALEAIGPFREDMPVYGDWEFNVRFLAAFDVGFIDEPLANWHHRVELSDQSEYSNSVTGHHKKHIEVETRERNGFLRRYLAEYPASMGLLANFAGLMEPLSALERRALMAEGRVEELQRSLVGTEQHLHLAIETIGNRDASMVSLSERHQELLVRHHDLEVSAAAALQAREEAAAAAERSYKSMISDRDSRVSDRDDVIAALHNSASWRVTAPLRWLISKFK